MVYTKFIPRVTRGARVEENLQDNGRKAYRLSIPAGAATQYRLAQIDDYAQRRSHFPWRFPFHLSLSARTSSRSIPGTWGFGLWNDPFGLSLGFGGNPLRLPALPNAAWFFGASEESYLSFRNGQPQGTGPTFPANGFLAQVFRSPRFHPLLIPAGLALPFSRKRTRRWIGKIVEEDGIQLSGEQHTPSGRARLQSVDPTRWHAYKIDWREEWVSFAVDDFQVLDSPVSPKPPLALVIWI